MPSNGELLDGDVVPLLISQAAEGWLAEGVGDSFRPQFLVILPQKRTIETASPLSGCKQ